MLRSIQSMHWSSLPSDLQFYLAYFHDNITHYHYFMLHDSNDFFHSILTPMAVQDEALLHAIVGFATYHHTLQNGGRIDDFLRYYNKSVTLLLNFLKNRRRNTVATLLTILQLATIEVGHQL